MAIIKGARNLDAAKKFVDWALTRRRAEDRPRRQGVRDPDQSQRRRLPPQVPKLTDIKVINYDFAKYGASDTRKRLLERWEKESIRCQAAAMSAAHPDPPPFVSRFAAPSSSGCRRRCRVPVGALVRAAGHDPRHRLAVAIRDARTTRPRCCRSLVARTGPGSRPLGLIARGWRSSLLPAGVARRTRANALIALGATGLPLSLRAGLRHRPARRRIRVARRHHQGQRRAIRHGPGRRAGRDRVRDAVCARTRRARLLQGRCVRRRQRGRRCAAGRVFTFFPVLTDPDLRRCRTRRRSLAAGILHARCFTEKIWGMGCIVGSTRCGVAWNTLMLALLCAVGLHRARPRIRADRHAARASRTRRCCGSCRSCRSSRRRS